MQKRERIAKTAYQSVVTTFGLFCWLTILIVFYPEDIQWGILGASVIAIAVLVNFPIQIFNQNITLLHLVPLGVGLIAAPIQLSLSLPAGILLGRYWGKRFSRSTTPRLYQNHRWLETGALIGSNLIPLSFYILLYFRIGEIYALLSSSQSFPLSLILPALVFALIHGGLFFLGSDYQSSGLEGRFRADITNLLLVETLSVLFPLICGYILSFAGVDILYLFWILIFLLGLVGVSLFNTRQVMARRVQELSILGQVNQTLRSSLELDLVLPVIQNQVSAILGVDNFYVALVDGESDELWYPLAVKKGERQEWARRTMEDRLTDRVIKESKPLLLTPQTQAGPNPVGLPPSEDTPASWLGVPLIVSEQAIGCLAVSELTTGIEFSSDDIDLLNLISGQVSVAIHNALLYQQAQIRATHLETINHLTSSISSSLNPQQVLTQICRSAALIVNAQSSAVYLVDQSEETVRLAEAYHLSDHFIVNDGKYPIAQNKRTRCLRTGRPSIYPDIQKSTLSLDLVRLFKDEGIIAFADLPLITTGGVIGFLSIFFTQTHTYQKEDMDLLQIFASQAALALSNARLHAVTGRQLSRKVHQLALLEAVGRELSAAIQSHDLFRLILQYAMELTDAESGYVSIFREDSGDFEVMASLDRLESRGTATQNLTSQQSVNTPIKSKLDHAHANFSGESHQKMIDKPFFLTVRIERDSRVLGLIELESSKEGSFGPSEESLVGQLAIQAAIALQNANLFADVSYGRDRLSAIINTVKEGIILVDTDGRILLVNEPILNYTGVAYNEFSHKNLSDLPAQALEVLNYTKEQALELQSAYQIREIPAIQKTEYKVQRAAAHPMMLERETSPVYGAEGHAIGWMIVLRDKTEEYEVAQARDIITQTLVHDLRSPMSAVVGAIDLIESTLVEDNRDDIIRQAIRVAHSGANRVLSLVETLLEISRLESSQLELVYTPITIPHLVQELLPDFVLLANESGLYLQNQVPGDLPTVMADVEKLKRVLTNLLDNAVKFTPAGGCIRISAAETQGFVVLNVADSGPGIPEEYREKIFDRFFQVPERRSSRRGSGLGLAFCKLAIEAHQGRIWVEPEPAGGSLFSICLPIQPENLPYHPPRS